MYDPNVRPPLLKIITGPLTIALFSTMIHFPQKWWIVGSTSYLSTIVGRSLYACVGNRFLKPAIKAHEFIRTMTYEPVLSLRAPLTKPTRTSWVKSTALRHPAPHRLLSPTPKKRIPSASTKKTDSVPSNRYPSHYRYPESAEKWPWPPPPTIHIPLQTPRP